MPRHFSGRRGNYAVWTASSIFMMLGFSAIVIDVGSIYSTRAQLVVAADAAALAGASHLDGTEEGMVEARKAAEALGHANGVTFTPIPVDRLDIQLGTWDGASHVFVASSDPKVVDTVQVTISPWSVWTPFAGAAWSDRYSDVFAVSHSRRKPPTGAVSVDCFLPIALATCQVDKIEAKGHPWVGAFRMATDSLDDMAWSHPAGRGASVIQGALIDAATGECGHRSLEVGDETLLSNGVEASTLHTAEDLMRSSGDPWDGELWGGRPARDSKSVFTQQVYPNTGIIQGPIMVFDAGVPCDQVKYARTATIEYFVWGAIFDVYQGPGSRRGIQLYLDLEHPFEVPGEGGAAAGNVVSWPAGRLVE